MEEGRRSCVPAVAVRHLAKSYGDKQAVSDVSFAVEKGGVFALLGPNGAGKTTIIEILEDFRQRGGWSSRSWPSSPTTACLGRGRRHRGRSPLAMVTSPLEVGDLLLGRHFNGQSETFGGIGHPTVVGEDGPKLSADELRRSQVDRIEAAQLLHRHQGCRAIE